MRAIPQTLVNLYPCWMAAHGDKFVVAQEQAHAINAFKAHYGMNPSVVINGLYAAKVEAPIVGNNARR